MKNIVSYKILRAVEIKVVTTSSTVVTDVWLPTPRVVWIGSTVGGSGTLISVLGNLAVLRPKQKISGSASYSEMQVKWFSIMILVRMICKVCFKDSWLFPVLFHYAT